MNNRYDAFTFADLAQVTGGRWLDPLPCSRPGTLAVCDDTRQLFPGALFVAIRGEAVDGHDFLDPAVTTGAGAVCIQRELSAALVTELRVSGVPRLLVADTLAAYQELALAHRLRYPQLPVVAITGSCGKTSTKEMIAAVLNAQFPGAVLKTEGNTNNHFGVPRNLLRLNLSHRAAILELGSNHPGEIAGLVRLVRPRIGVVSNIGHAHLEFFRNLAGVAAEKGSLFAGVDPDGIAIYPSEAEHADILRQQAGSRRLLSFGAGPAADVRVQYHGASADGYVLTLTWRASGETRTFTWGLGGEHQALNAAAAAAVGQALGIAPDTIVAGLHGVLLPGMRMQVTVHAGVHWVNDAYNSNPDSARASLAWFREITAAADPARCFVVLGDMRELGELTTAAHLALLKHARALFPHSPILPVGAHMTAAAADCGVRAVPDAAAAKHDLENQVRSGDWVLLKASRGIRLETVLPGPVAEH